MTEVLERALFYHAVEQPCQERGDLGRTEAGDSAQSDTEGSKQLEQERPMITSFTGLV